MLFRKNKNKGNWIKTKKKIWVQSRASNEVFTHKPVQNKRLLGNSP